MKNVILDLIKMLRTQRESLGLSQREVANLVQIPQSHYSRVESGAVNVRLAGFVEIARVLEMEVVLVPRRLLPAIDAVLKSSDEERPSTPRPAYALDDAANDDDQDRMEERVW